MFDLLSPKWQAFIINRHKQKILTISSSPERTELFNFLLRSRKIAKTNQIDMLSSIVQALETASSINLADIEAEKSWFKMPSEICGKSSASPITLASSMAGFDYTNLE